MTIALAFWICMLIWLIFGVWTEWPNPRPLGRSLLLWFLLFLLGWGTFGFPLKG